MTTFYVVYSSYKIAEVEAFSFDGNELIYERRCKLTNTRETKKFKIVETPLSHVLPELYTDKGSFYNVRTIFTSYQEAYDYCYKHLTANLEEVISELNEEVIRKKVQALKDADIKSKELLIARLQAQLNEYILQSIDDKVETTRKSLLKIQNNLNRLLEDLKSS